MRSNRFWSATGWPASSAPRRAARLAVLAAVAIGAARSGRVDPSSVSDDKGCPAWVAVASAEVRAGRAVEQWWCGAPPHVLPLGHCPPSPPVRAGDRVHLDARGCPERTEPLGGHDLIALGLGIDPNEARPEALTAIRGIGPGLASGIVAGRPYAQIEDLRRVRGIGPARLRALDAAIRLEPRPLLWPGVLRLDASSPQKP